MNRCISGKDIASTLKKKLAEQVSLFEEEIVFSIIYVGQDPVIDNFIRYKKKFGADIGVKVVVHLFDEKINQTELIDAITDISHTSHAVIVQLPLPRHLDIPAVLNSVPVEKDIDVLSEKAQLLFKSGNFYMLPPVTGALVEVLKKIPISLSDKKIVLVGYGDLVGKPFGIWLTQQGIEYSVIIKNTELSEKKRLLQEADIIVSGVGEPSLITPEQIHEGVILLDAGTSEIGKKILGDIDPDCYEKTSYYTPVPGGIGPITIAILYSNIINSINN